MLEYGNILNNCRINIKLAMTFMSVIENIHGKDIVTYLSDSNKLM